MKNFYIFQLVVFDSDSGEMNCGYFTTRQLAMEQKYEIEKEWGSNSIAKEEYEIRKIKVNGS
jgi:hypothetical protein